MQAGVDACSRAPPRPPQVSLMTESGDTKDDLQLPSGTDDAEKLAQQIKADFDAGKELQVSVMKVRGVPSVQHSCPSLLLQRASRPPQAALLLLQPSSAASCRHARRRFFCRTAGLRAALRCDDAWPPWCIPATNPLALARQPAF